MDNKILILVVLIIIVGIITIGLIGWQTGFVVKNEEIESKGGLKLVEKPSADENEEQTTSTTPTITGDIIKITSKSSGGGSGGSGSDGSGSDGTILISQSNVELSIVPSSLTQQKNKEFTINVDISSEEEIFAADFELTYNPEILQLISITKGDFLNSDGADTYEVIKNESGKIIFASTRFNTQTGVSGKGTLAIIDFKAKNAGISDLTLANVKIADVTLDGNKFQASTKNGKVTIT